MIEAPNESLETVIKDVVKKFVKKMISHFNPL